MSERKQQLSRALATARATHRSRPSSASEDAVLDALLAVRSFDNKAEALVLELDECLRNGSANGATLIEKRIAEHNEARPDRLAVKLVDSAGTLRLDMNGHRVHMNDQQAGELFLQLGAALDKTETDDLSVACEAYPNDALVAGSEYGQGLLVMRNARAVRLSKAKLIQLSAFLAGLADEIEGE